MELTDKEEKLVKKIKKDFPEFFDGAQGLTTGEIEQKLKTHAKHREEIISSRENNVKLNAAKKEVRDLDAPFRDGLKAVNLRTKYLYLLMRQKGGA